MMNPFRLGRRPGEWLREKGPEGDVIISTRIRLARNVDGFPFAARLEKSQAQELTEALKSKVLEASRPHPYQYINLGRLDPIWRRVLVERHLVSREHAKRDRSNGVVIGAEEVTSVMLNEEDHIRTQILRSGWRPGEAYEMARELDGKISRQVTYARSPEFGYLTSCPTNAGTGLRVSAMVHLPAMVLSAEIGAIVQDCEENELEVRGLYGEGSRAYGDLFQVSNRVTMGLPEDEIIHDCSAKILALAARERQARQQLRNQPDNPLGEQIAHAVKSCTTSSTVTSSDAMKALSLLRLGIHMGLYEQLPIARINELFLWTQPGHLQQLVGRTMRRVERDSVRAQLVRRWCARHLPLMS